MIWLEPLAKVVRRGPAELKCQIEPLFFVDHEDGCLVFSDQGRQRVLEARQKLLNIL